ncbi:hypothetical protein JAAARDRAFT_34308 [Jaapia argillacea MUCL 33604]|uniref:Uncharacterized protein n=1 Tax=Jaapia argillacea MUCL 33604 TaxID=933084 RepID=A0A067PUK5_9AGAM|nr:hypothetical protein JAAARDRAFT_34308 [Jaapia argillacea MUCL 33604]
MHQLDSCRIACWDSDSKLQAATSQLRESRADGRRMKEKLEEGELRRREIEGKNAALKQQAEEGELRRREIEGENAALKQQVEEGELRRREIEENNATLRKKVESQAANIQALTNQLLGRARDTSWTKRNDRSEEMVQGSLAVAPPRRRARSSNGRSTANCPPTALPLPTIPLPKITPREVHQRFDRFLTPGTP